MSLLARDMMKYRPPSQNRDRNKETIKTILREDRELLNEILTELRNEKINKIKDGI